MKENLQMIVFKVKENYMILMEMPYMKEIFLVDFTIKEKKKMVKRMEKVLNIMTMEKSHMKEISLMIKEKEKVLNIITMEKSHMKEISLMIIGKEKANLIIIVVL